MRAVLPLTAIMVLGACSLHAEGDAGRHMRQDFAVGPFQTVALTGSTDVVVTVGGAPSVRAEGNKAAVERLDIRVENGALKIGTKNHIGWSWDFGGRHNHVTVYVTTPSLAGAAITGSGDMKIDKVAGSDFDASVTGSGDLNVASLQVARAGFKIAGSGDVDASGKAQQATINVAGSGDFRAGRLEIGNATVSVIGSGDVTAHATQTADVTVTGSGDVKLSGPAKCSIHKMGSGEVRCGA